MVKKNEDEQMKMVKYMFAAGALAARLAFAASVRETRIELKTYPFSDPDPVPCTAERRYPYFRYDGSTDDATTQTWSAVVLENEKIRVVMLPQVGGKIWAATDKVAGKDFIYCNHVMKFRDIAMRGPWVSGGIEFNFGVIGHAPSSSTPVDWLARTNADGSVSCFVSSEEYITRTVWQVETRLGADDDAFTTRVSWYNSSGLPAPYYHWMNAAYSVRGNPRFLFPGKTVVGHEGEIETRTWPFDAKGRRLDSYLGNAFGGPKSYHVLPGDSGFYGIWWPESGFGSFHRCESYEKYGRKIWLWALSREGGIWEDLLTDGDGQYAELQSGRCFNQPRGGNYATPFKHPAFAPGSTEVFSETWGPIRDPAEAVKASAGANAPEPRPVDPPAAFDWDSAYGRYVRGTQYMLERADAKGAECLRESVAKDPFFAPSLVALAGYELRRGGLDEVHALCRRAMAIDAYDAGANYLDGYAYFIEGDGATARDRLGLAAFQPQFRSAALALIARSYLRDGDQPKALAAAEKSLASNAENRDALLAKTVALRGTERFRPFAEGVLARWPLFHAVRYELWKAGQCASWTERIGNELPHETFLEIGSWYEETGLAVDAKAVFSGAGPSIAAKIRLGDYAAAKQMPVSGVFPFRRETLKPLEKAVADDGHWKFRYLLGVLQAYFGRDKEADALLDGLGGEPDESVVYQYRATRRRGGRRLEDLESARRLCDGWRVGLRLAEHFEDEKDFKSMLASTARYVALYPSCNPLQIAHARALLGNRRFRECLDYMEGIRLLPSEHGDAGTDVWHAAQDALGLKRTWPENLGRGEPYPADGADL